MSDKYDLNVIWQSPDGTWNRAFYDYDNPQGHREYDLSAFRWVSTGHESQEDAFDSWDGDKDGDWRVVADPADIEHCEDLAGEAHLEASGRVPEHTVQFLSYAGPPKQRSPERLARDLAEACVAYARHRDRGLANTSDSRIDGWSSVLDEMTVSNAHARAQARRVFAEVADSFEQEAAGYGMTVENGIIRFPRVTVRPHAEGLIATLRSRYASEASTAPSTGGSARRKTTAASTSGSFAPKLQSNPEITLS